jgi:hypothetical protein
MIRAAFVVALLVSGCALLPPELRPIAAAPPPVSCEAPPVPGPALGCREAIEIALGLLDNSHQPIATIDFSYQCSGPHPDLAPDCAVQFFGTVVIHFVGPDFAPDVVVDVRPGADLMFVGRIRQTGMRSRL